MQFKWQKLGKIFDPRDFQGPQWLHEYAQAPSVVVFQSFIRIYFSCRPAPDVNGQFVSYSAYVDLDRHDLTRILRISDQPVLTLGERGTFDEFGTYPISVTILRAFYGGWTRCESVPFNVAIGAAISHDSGESFQKLGRGPALSYSLDEPFILSGPKIRKFNDTYYLFYIAGRDWILAEGRPEPVYKIRMASSHDGVEWTKLNKDLVESRIEPNEAQASPDVFFANDKYHMFFCYRYSTGYRGHSRGYRIGYAQSTNLVDWHRDDDNAGIDVSINGWDSEMISYPHVFNVDGETYMAYLGNQVGRYGFGIAKLEGDFV
jgi:hypothetical protein